MHLRVGRQLPHGPSWAKCIYFLYVRSTLHRYFLTVKGHELHLGAIDAFLGEALAGGEGYLGLVLLFVADGNAVLVFLGAGGAEGVDEVQLYRRHFDMFKRTVA